MLWFELTGAKVPTLPLVTWACDDNGTRAVDIYQVDGNLLRVMPRSELNGGRTVFADAVGMTEACDIAFAWIDSRV